MTVGYGGALELDLDGYEQQIIELRPLSEREARIEGVRYGVEESAKGELRVKLYAPAGSTATVRLKNATAYAGAESGGEIVALQPAGNQADMSLRFGAEGTKESQPNFSAPVIQDEGPQNDAKSLRVSLSVQIPADFEESRVSLLLQPEQKTAGVKAEVRIDGKAAEVAVRKSEGDLWYWFSSDLAAGHHTLDFDLHLPAGPQGRMRISGWLRAKRRLASKELRLKFKAGHELTAPAENLLPTACEMERNTYALFDEDLH
jgi:hypothetical protein